ncbi:MAG: BRCT domain-containing protein, partial [Bacteroidota bacterium]
RLAGKSLVVSGTFENYSRDGIKKIIELHSGKVLSAVSAKTDYLVAGANLGPEKRKKAEKLNVEIITEEEFNRKILG